MSNENSGSTALFVVIISSAAALIAAVFFITHFELYKTTRLTGPSEAARRNLYLALDRWLDAEGHNVRIIESGSPGDIDGAKESTALIFSSSFDWYDYPKLAGLIYSGINAVIFIDDAGEENLSELLKTFNITSRVFAPVNDKESGGGENYVKGLELDNEVYFDIIPSKESADWQIIKDKQKNIRLIGAKFGEGSVYACGIPYFMTWDALTDSAAGEEGRLKTDNVNAEYAWRFSAALDEGGRGIIVFRGKEAATNKGHYVDEPSFWERLLENKNIALVFISAAILCALGFWMTLKSFGRWKPERVFPGKPITERFLREGRFYKKHKCLSVYLEPAAEALLARYRFRGITGESDILNLLIKEHSLDALSAAKILNPKDIRTVKELRHYRRLALSLLDL